MFIRAQAYIACACSIVSANAGLIYWGTEGYVEYRDSRGQSWTPAFTLEFGVFRTGFTPTFANRGDWQANWIEIGQAQFDPEESRFAGVVDDSLTLPNDAGNQVYFWAKNGADLTKGPEWLLVTRTQWLWPEESSPTRQALSWTTGSVASPFLGTITQPARAHLSSRVRPVPVTITQWLAARFPGQPEKQVAALDPDFDGLSNLLEYFLGSDPADGSSIVSPVIATNATGTTLSLSLNPYAESLMGVEESQNLITWGPATTTPVEDRPDFISVWVPRNPLESSMFFRVGLKPASP